MDEHAAIVFGTLVGTTIGSIGLVVVLGFKLWPGVRRLLNMTEQVEHDLDEALGKRKLEDSKDSKDAPDTGEHRRQTGAFQTAVRTEIEPVALELARVRVNIADLKKGQESLRRSVDGQAAVVAGLARGHKEVVRRVNEHSAELNVAQAAESMTNGKVAR